MKDVVVYSSPGAGMKGYSLVLSKMVSPGYSSFNKSHPRTVGEAAIAFHCEFNPTCQSDKVLLRVGVLSY